MPNKQQTRKGRHGEGAINFVFAAVKGCSEAPSPKVLFHKNEIKKGEVGRQLPCHRLLQIERHMAYVQRDLTFEHQSGQLQVSLVLECKNRGDEVLCEMIW